MKNIHLPSSLRTVLAGASLLLASAGFASASKANESNGFADFLKGVEAELVEQKIDPQLFWRGLGDDTSPDTSATKKMANQPEFTYSFQRYYGSMVSDARVKRGREMYQQHKDILQRISAESGVPAEVIVAMWGVESFYGRFSGNHRIVRALATLAYDSHRKDFFRRELIASVRILQEGHIEPENMLGSWAGAMGQCQFMPTSFLAYAADGDGDGKKDIWNNPADVFASAAKFLKDHGWKRDQRLFDRVVLTKNLPKLDLNTRGLSQSPKTIAEWKKIGIAAASGELPADSTRAWLFMPEGPSKRSYLVYDNFNVIMSWNHSSHFAFSALSLANEIAVGQGS